MKSSRAAFGWAVALFALATAGPAVGAAAEEPLIPPGNSAVNQYTESFPSGGGDKELAGNGKRPPREVLGPSRTKRLEERGEDGRAVAAVAAETAPAALPSRPGAEEPETAAIGHGGGVDPGKAETGDAEAKEGRPNAAAGIDARGSSGFAEVLEQATGSSDSGELGLLFPLTILAALALSVVFLLRRNRRAEP